MKALINSLCAVAAMSLVADGAARAGVLEGESIDAVNYHGNQPDHTQSYSATCVVAPGVEFNNFGVTVFINGQPQPGVFKIDISDTNITITLNANMPFTYFEALMFFDASNTIPPFTSVAINPASDWNGFSASNIYVSPNYIAIYPPYGGLAGQVISIDLPDACPADAAAPADGAVNVADLLAVINNWGRCAYPVDCTADVDNNGSVNVSDLLGVINAWGACP